MTPHVICVFSWEDHPWLQNTLQPTAVSWTDPAYQVSITSFSQSLPMIATALPSQFVVYILLLLDWRLLYMFGKKKKKKRLQEKPSKSWQYNFVVRVWCLFLDIATCSMFLFSRFLDQYVLNRSGFQRSQLFQLIFFFFLLFFFLSGWSNMWNVQTSCSESFSFQYCRYWGVMNCCDVFRLWARWPIYHQSAFYTCIFSELLSIKAQTQACFCFFLVM